ncbi:OLC1v1033665C1 [Oldenlandia corymbosa var. corymbosa]|uniref:OLC1v1033665C1 n=1 Tax=Oldenlandia corymbosa var. corymbosa TaxID=529605 RepID=A0AAV1CQ17_OLDCO|nr:OLC1v1033665C1 [Oldenlandia corymbosa var. corymbosa]
MPNSKKAKKYVSEQPLMAIPEALYFEDYGLILKNPSSSSKRLRNKKVDLEAEMKLLSENFGVILKNPSPSKRVRNKKDDIPGEIKALPENIKNKIIALGGPSSESSITFVFQKVLTATDVNANQSRLLIPFKKLKDHSFLTEKERNMLGKRYDKTEGGNNHDLNSSHIFLSCLR